MNTTDSGPVYRFGDYRLDAAQRTLTRRGAEIALTPTLFEILRVLVENAGRILDKERFMERVWAGRIVEDGNLARNVSTLRKLLEDDPHHPRYIETIARRGYRFVAEVEPVAVEGDRPHAERRAEDASRRSDAAPMEPPGDVAASVSSAGTPGITGRRHGSRRWFPPVAGSRFVRVSVVAACLGLFGIILAAAYIGPVPAGTRIDTVMVLPFVNLSGDPDVEYIADSLTDVLITNLGQIAALEKVISFHTSMSYKGSRKRLPEIAGEVGVDAVVGGAVLVDGDRIRITMQVVEAATERRLAGTEATYEGRLEDVLSLQSRIARTVARTIEIVVTPEESRRLAAAVPERGETSEAYLQGLFLKHKQTVESLNQAIEHFTRALETEPDFAPALGALGDTYIMLASWQGPSRALWPKAREAADRALEIDDALAEALLVRAGALLCHDLDRAAADRVFQHAIALNPHSALARHRYAYSLMTQGRFDESLAEARRALEQNPLSIAHHVMLGKILFHAGRYDEARRQLESTLGDPFPEAHRTLGRLELETQEIDRAIAAFERAIADGGGPGVLGELAYAYGIAGREQDALGLLDRLEELSRDGRDTAFSIALLYHGLGDSGLAFEWLDRAHHERDFRMVLLAVDPIWNSLRPDPRFQELLHRIGLGSNLPA
jgi:DNA-binding winged helix-turn-helix (wHTH) protein/TolB-like protein/Tfp pilus assembly protein PilF